MNRFRGASKYITFIFIFFSVAICRINAQGINKKQVDSLEQLLKTLPKDSSKFNTYVALEDIFFYSDYARSKKCMEEAYALAKEIHYRKGEAFTLSEIGVLTSELGDNRQALRYLFQSLEPAREIKDSALLSQCFNNLGYMYKLIGNIDSSLFFYKKSLSIKEKLGDKKLLGYAYINIGYIYHQHVNSSVGMSYYRKALQTTNETGDSNLRSEALNNIAYVFKELRNFDSAYFYFNEGYKLAFKSNKKSLQAKLLNSLSSLDELKGNYDKALSRLNESLEIDKELNNAENLSIVYERIASVYIKKKDFKKANEFAKQALEIAKAHKLPDAMLSAYFDVSKSCFGLKDYYNAYLNYENYTLIKDSIFNIRNSALLTENEAKYQNEKKQLQIGNLEKENELRQSETKKAKLQRIFFATGFLLMIVIAIIIFRGYKQKQKDNLIISEKKEEVEKQKNIIEETQKDIIDSITYAKRLQSAILPPISSIKKYFKDSFVLYKPKSIVAGDFYWMEIVNQQKKGIGSTLTEDGNANFTKELILIAVADCTGHGVPGAMVSVVCSNALNRAVKEFGLTDPGLILDKVSDLVIETFGKSGEDINDGMDISLISVDVNRKESFWSGANNPLWYVEDGKFHELTADKQPIGKSDKRKAFTTHKIKYKESTIFYLLTDGYADQFGGPKGKKFKYKQLQELISKNVNVPLETQGNILDSAFTQWKGDIEQVDDVCLIGIKPQA